VQELLEGDAPDFAMLEARDFIRRRSGSTLAGEREFAFKHALTREVAYASLPAGRRARLHAAFADRLERIAEGRDDQATFLAHHYAEAVRPDNADQAWDGRPEELERLRAGAVAWLRRAADLAVGRYELDEAIGLYERALELAGAVELEVELWRALGRANALKYDGDGLWNAMQNAIELCTDEQTQAGLYAELAHETAIRSGMWRRMPDYPTVDEWMAAFEELELAWHAEQTRALL
jgi:predicted ATPase